ncbi:inorganic diphosphatase [Nitrogeniibacter aestuarii]|uniref:inorganic diphosphatase n=1 Tax=Nitrogeniibacter aestuarii TaxID=2815343 RepID=UPI001E36B809|nr:inorganic diphosphatase [Nitrogeniibacter aestuarii]
MNTHAGFGPASPSSTSTPPLLEIVIEVPRGSFLKRGSSGHIDFISPLPCPFNYGSVPDMIGLEGDLLDALVLGPRLPYEARITLPVWGAVTLMDRGMIDDKLICCAHEPSAADIETVLRFFSFYARCKWWLNLVRGRSGRNACEGWISATEAIARARPRTEAWAGPDVTY